MELNLGEKEYRNLWTFLVETFEFTEEQTAAIDHQIPMTQEMFDSILDRCDEIGKNSDKLFFRMLKEYPQYTDIRAERILNEIEELDIAIPTEEEWEIESQKLYARIGTKYGENTI